MSEVRNDPAKRQYELLSGGKVIGQARYRQVQGAVELYHTEVDDGHEGEGLGSQLAKFALDDLRAQGQQVIPSCPFIAHYIKDHPAYLDMVQA